MADNKALDKLIDDVYNQKPAYEPKRRKPIVKQIRLYPHDLNDVAVERILDDWADDKMQNANIKKSIGMYYAAERKDIEYFENNHSWLVAEIQLAGRHEMQKQVDAMKDEIKQLRAEMETLRSNTDQHRQVIQVMYPTFQFIRSRTPLEDITITGQTPQVLAAKTKVKDGE